MYISIVILALFIPFAFAAVLDHVFLNDRLGLGPEIEKGLLIAGKLCMVIIGIVSLVPLITFALESSFAPFLRQLGIDPSIVAGTLVSSDLGGLYIAQDIAMREDVGLWAGAVYGSIMGTCISFSIPAGIVAMGKRSLEPYLEGILFGISAIPLGSFFGGLILHIAFAILLKSLLVPLIFSVLIIVGLLKYRRPTLAAIKAIGAFINALALFGLVLAATRDLVLAPLSSMGVVDLQAIPLFNMLRPARDGIVIAGNIALVLIGVLPFIKCVQKWFAKPLEALSHKMQLGDYGIVGLILTCANNAAMFALLPSMTSREIRINAAFQVGAAGVIGGQMAFIATQAPKSLSAMMLAKALTGILAILIALFFLQKQSAGEDQAEKVSPLNSNYKQHVQH